MELFTVNRYGRTCEQHAPAWGCWFAVSDDPLALRVVATLWPIAPHDV
jgi:hypothetical protein